MSTVSLLPVYIVLVSLVAIIPIVLSRKSQNLREFWTFVAGFLKVGLVFSMLPWILKGNILQYTFFEILPGVSFGFKVDGLGMLFAMVASTLWIVTSLYSIGYMRGLKEHAQTRFFAFFSLSLSATLAVAFSANLFTLYVFYEILSLSTYPLVTHHQGKDAKSGGRRYLTYLLGTSIGFALPAIIITYSLTGSLDFSSQGLFVGQDLGVMLPILLLLFMYGFGKAGLMPLHAWLPGAMVAPTPVSSLLHAVAVVKVGVFCVIRVITGVFGTSYLTTMGMVPLICFVAGFTVITASLIALYQDSLKRRLAFSTVGQLAYIILGVGLCTELGVIGGTSHIVMHAFGKITLFFCAGAIYVATSKKNISDMAGLGRKMPYTFAAFFLGSLSVIGLPISGGIVSKWYMLNGAMQANLFPVVIVYLVSSFLNACYFLPIVYNAFFKDVDYSKKVAIKEAPLACVIPPVITAVVSVCLFFKADVFLALARLIL
ncbi:cation:proton antiporter [Candidatus Marinamargulisbacteria bacterium SCGC AG-439-L15]|nr:cation:proton antiporter [Candidatus Marinamargulisbacteria bacterium SCGC AG-439-L15]